MRSLKSEQCKAAIVHLYILHRCHCIHLSLYCFIRDKHKSGHCLVYPCRLPKVKDKGKVHLYDAATAAHRLNRAFVTVRSAYSLGRSPSAQSRSYGLWSVAIQPQVALVCCFNGRYPCKSCKYLCGLLLMLAFLVDSRLSVLWRIK